MQYQSNKSHVKNSLELLIYLRKLFENKELSTKSVKSVIDNSVQICQGCENEFYKDIIGAIELIASNDIYDHELIRSYVIICDYYVHIKTINEVMLKFKILEMTYPGYKYVMSDLSNMSQTSNYIIKNTAYNALTYIEKKLFTVLNFTLKNEYVQLYILFAMIAKGTENIFNIECKW